MLRLATLAFGVTLCLAGPAHAMGRSPQTWRASAGHHHHSDVLTEAARWIGRGNPTPFREAWCRDFINFVLMRTGHRVSDHTHLAITAVRLGRRVANPRPGDIAVMRGHVTFFKGWDGPHAFLGLGGNQRGRVRISRFYRGAVVAFIRV